MVLSLMMGTVKLWLVMPGAKVSVPAVVT